MFVQTAMALARLQGCACLPESSLFALKISTFFSHGFTPLWKQDAEVGKGV